MSTEAAEPKVVEVTEDQEAEKAPEAHDHHGHDHDHDHDHDHEHATLAPEGAQDSGPKLNRGEKKCRKAM
jgi:hypothetical protein